MMKVALVGFGLAGKTFHAPLISGVEDLELSCIVSSRVNELHKLYPNTKVFSKFEDALKEDIDLVVIATPNHLHFSQALLALHAGKHVVIDKPIAATVEEARELESLAKEKDLVLSVFHNRRYDGDFLTIKKMLTEKKLGKVVYFESNFNRFRPEVDKTKWRETTEYAGGLFYDLAPHLIDQALNLFGKPKKVFADITTLRQKAQNDDYFHLIFDYGDKKIHLNASNLTAYVGERFKLHGDKDSYYKFGMDVQEEQLKAGMNTSDSKFGVDDTHGQLQFGGQHKNINGNYIGFYKNISKVLTGKASLEIRLEEVIDVMQLIENCTKSQKSNSWQDV